MQTYNTFREYLISEHKDNLQDIANNGCSGGVHGMTYYEETTELYKLYANELLKVIADFNTEYSTQVSVYGSSEDELYNTIVWAAAEIIASDIHYN